MTNREEVLKVWEGHYSELLNHEGNMSDLGLLNYVHEKLKVIEITDLLVTRGLEGMKKKKGRAPGWDEMRWRHQFNDKMHTFYDTVHVNDNI